MSNKTEWLNKTSEELESEYFRAYHDFRKYSDMEVSFGLHSPGGGTIGEMTMKWIKLDGRMVPQLQVFDDGWKVLNCFSDLMSTLADKDSNNISVDEFIVILKECGFLSPSDMWDGDFIPHKVFQDYQKQRQRNKKIKQLV